MKNVISISNIKYLQYNYHLGILSVYFYDKMNDIDDEPFLNIPITEEVEGILNDLFSKALKEPELLIPAGGTPAARSDRTFDN